MTSPTVSVWYLQMTDAKGSACLEHPIPVRGWPSQWLQWLKPYWTPPMSLDTVLSDYPPTRRKPPHRRPSPVSYPTNALVHKWSAGWKPFDTDVRMVIHRVPCGDRYISTNAPPPRHVGGQCTFSYSYTDQNFLERPPPPPRRARQGTMASMVFSLPSRTAPCRKATESGLQRPQQRKAARPADGTERGCAVTGLTASV